MANHFYYATRPGNQLIEFDVHNTRPDNPMPDCKYFTSILAKLDERANGCNLKFVIAWDLDKLPIAGQDVVVILIGDEMSQMPAYAGRVRAVFKTGGIKPFHPIQPLDQPFYSLLEMGRMLRNLVRRYHRYRWTSHSNSQAVFPIPLGYFVNAQSPVVPIEQRKWDVFFAGIAGNPKWNQPRSWIWRPRAYSRYRLGQAVVRWRANYPSYRCNFVSTVSEQSAIRLSPAEYALHLADSKICLVPRGNYHETYRFFEAARAGCVLISEPLPNLWYYEDQPAIIIDDWEQLGQALLQILSSPTRLLERHEQSLAWWQKWACEDAVASYIVDQIMPK